MTQASPGDTVRIHYTGRFPDGAAFDSSRDGDPLEFRLGAGEIIAGLDEAITGMSVGDSEIVTIPAEKAYGAHHPEAVQSIPREMFPAHIELAPGLRLQAERPDGATIPLTVIEVSAESVRVDANHPLAGHDLVFEIELVEIV
ncbi:MAG TPA: peptidylprolyl isomerase [Paracoccaceae bacterium]|nr:peptidylprolyl isomerase [Paracoccaceae bacterium]